MTAVCTVILGSCSRNLSRVSAHKPSAVLTDSANLQAAAVITHSVKMDTLSNPLHNRITISVADSYYMARVNTKTTELYNSSAFQTKWLHDLAPGPLYNSAIDILKNASQYGLNPYDYDVAAIEQRVQNLYKSAASSAAVADLDIHISEMYFLFTTHLTEGRIRSVANGKNVWKRDVREGSGNDVVMLMKAENGDQLLAGLNALQPGNEQYLKLQQALAYYRSLDQQNQIPLQAISVKSAVKPGELNSAVPLIRKKLALTDLKPYPVRVDSLTGIVDSLRYDQALVEGVKMFQRRHGLEPDGVIGEKTLKFMNQSFREKADVIALNMERLRWAPANYGENYIAVNVPEYKMRVFDQEKMTLEMKVIVGASNKPTPIFSEQLEHIVFSPTWTVPVSIIREEIIPHLRTNPDYYASKNFIFYKNEVEIDPALENWNDVNINPYQYRVVQNPGSDNSLGSVKFMMPNNLSVYLHDTPNHRLFTKDYRALSHGCVRLDEPAKFAEYLLRDQKGWTADRIVKAMNDSTPSTIHLKKHYQVHIEYRTAWVDENNMVNFREDIYGHDKAQLRQLQPVVNTLTASAGM
jgi:murein L,D-transpeptidase YcbB/YkuD